MQQGQVEHHPRRHGSTTKSVRDHAKLVGEQLTIKPRRGKIMPESIRHKERRVQEAAGPRARVQVRPNKRDIVRTIIRCKDCQWTSPSDGKCPGQGSTPAFALAQWTGHRYSKHAEGNPDTVAEARAFLNSLTSDERTDVTT